MRKLIITLLVVLMASTTLSAVAFKGKAEVGTSTKDVFRGDVVEDGMVINPNLRLRIGRLSFKANSVFNLNEMHMTRTYLTAAFEIGLDNGLMLTPFVSYHHFWPETLDSITKDLFDSTAEAGLRLHYNLYGRTFNKAHDFAVSLYSTHYLNVQSDIGAYRGNLGIKMVDIFGKMGIGFSADVSWGWYVEDNKIENVEIPNIQLPHTLNTQAYFMLNLTDNLYVKAHGEVTITINPEMRDALGDDAQIYVGGVNVGMEF